MSMQQREQASGQASPLVNNTTTAFSPDETQLHRGQHQPVDPPGKGKDPGGGGGGALWGSGGFYTFSAASPPSHR